MVDTPLNLSGIDDALVVRVGSAGRGRRSARQVYVIPLNVLKGFERTKLSSADQRQLDKLFAQATSPKVEAAIVHLLHIFDGSGD